MSNGYYEVDGSTLDCECQSGSVSETTNTASAGADGSGNEVRIGIRFQIDIPIGAVIDSAKLYIWQDYCAAVDPGVINIALINNDNCPAFGAGYNPYSNGLASPTPVAWTTSCSGNDASWRENVPDLATLVQAYVRRPGYQPNQYMGLLFYDPSPTTGRFFKMEQWDYGSSDACAIIFIAWHHDALGQGCNYWSVAGTDDDTWNSSDDSNDKTSEDGGRFGQIEDGNKSTSEEYSRVAFRWQTDTIPAGATINNAQIVMWADATDSTACDAQIGAMTSCNAFGAGEYAAMASFIGAAYTWSSVTAWTVECVYATPNIATQVSNRISDGNYDPDGAGEDPWVAIAIRDDGDKNNANAHREVAFYDDTTMPEPYLVVCYAIDKTYKPNVASTGSFMMY